MNKYGTKRLYKDRKYHREDGPVKCVNGAIFWYKEGKYHREDGPAIEYANGSKIWYKEGELHREDGPAVDHADGTKYWYKENKLHRDNGPAAEYPNGSKHWWINDTYICDHISKNNIIDNLYIKTLNKLFIYFNEKDIKDIKNIFYLINTDLIQIQKIILTYYFK